MARTLLLLALLIAIAAFLWPNRGPVYPAGVLVADAPEQRTIANGQSWTVKQWTITPLADYHIRARVLETARYWFDAGSGLSPIDLFVGWQRMSDQAVLDQLSYWVRSRGVGYRPRTNTWPMQYKEVNSESANMHMVPADARILLALRNIKVGDIVDMRGYLIEARTAVGGRWRSSLSRTDEGEGACELMWLADFTNERKDSQ